jgi:hypothetical protein
MIRFSGRVTHDILLRQDSIPAQQCMGDLGYPELGIHAHGGYEPGCMRGRHFSSAPLGYMFISLGINRVEYGSRVPPTQTPH